MTDDERGPNDSVFDDAVQEMRRPVVRPSDAVDSIMDSLPSRARAPARPRGVSRVWGWLRAPRLSPLVAALGMAAAVLVTFTLRDVEESVDGARRAGPDLVRHQFVLVAPEAESVSVVGDFNDWDSGRTPLTRTDADGVWIIEVELEGGRHLYSFVIDGERWIPDARAPRAPDDDFGRPSSVLLIERGLKGT